MLPGVHSDMRLVFTVLDWDRFSSDDFLGQVSLPIPDIRSLATFAATNTPLDHEGCTVTRAEYTRTEGVGHGTYQFHLGNLGSNLNLRPEGFKISDEKEQGEGSIRVLLDHFGGLACCKCGDLQVGASKMDLNPAWVVLAGTTLFTYESVRLMPYAVCVVCLPTMRARTQIQLNMCRRVLCSRAQKEYTCPVLGINTTL